jgi:repressor LexA
MNKNCKKNLLTDRQEKVLEFVKDFLEAEGYPPTVRDIAKSLNIVSLNAVRRHLLAIEKKGRIRLEPGKSRGIQILEEPEKQIDEERKIPILGRVAAGPLCPAEQDIEGYLDIDPSFWGNSDEIFLLKVKGDSMFPKMEDGDLVVVRKQSSAECGSLIVAVDGDNEATVKQLIKKDGRYLLHPLNPLYKDIETDESFSINGLVIGLIRKL